MNVAELKRPLFSCVRLLTASVCALELHGKAVRPTATLPTTLLLHSPVSNSGLILGGLILAKFWINLRCTVMRAHRTYPEGGVPWGVARRHPTSLPARHRAHRRPPGRTTPPHLYYYHITVHSACTWGH